MNERIEKLGEQADLLGEFTPTKIPGRYVGYITEEQILKFAELIVEEVYDYILNATFDDEPWPSRKDVKQYFGVEL
jgi:hypothetical protein